MARYITIAQRALIRSVTEDENFDVIDCKDEVYRSLRTLQETILDSIAEGRVLEESAINGRKFRWASMGAGTTPSKRIELIESTLYLLENTSTIALLRALPIAPRRTVSDFSTRCAS